MPFLIWLVICLVIVGLALYIIDIIPMDGTIKQIIRIVVIVAVCLWLLSMLLPLAGNFPSPGYRRP